MSKQQPYKARVEERHFLNLPGHHAGAYINAYIEDTSQRGPLQHRADQARRFNPQPRIILELADCSERIYLEFQIDNPEERRNAFYKIDTLLSSLSAFREGLEAECAEYRRRQREIEQTEKA